MAWLDENPPARSQFRRGRRARVRPVIVGHTSESPADLVPPDMGASNVAGFIRRRSDPGSYHYLVDSREVIHLIELDNEAYHDGTGSNPWSYGIAAAARTVDWARMPAAHRQAVLLHLAVAAARCNDHAVRHGAGRVEARRITRAQSEAGVSGFIPHGDRDPSRRSDWGTLASAPFPWHEFWPHYLRAIRRPDLTTPQEPHMTEAERKMLAETRELANRAVWISQRAVDILEGRYESRERPTGPATGTLLGRVRDGVARLEAKG